MFEKIQNQCDQIVKSFDAITPERQAILTKIAAYIQLKKDVRAPIQLIYVCTHNSRRSQFGQIWAQVAASYYGVTPVKTFSGGTEVTAFNPNAIHALREQGFDIVGSNDAPNPQYQVYWGKNDSSILYSKIYDDPSNPRDHFAAIMTCSDAEQNCPMIAGAEVRIGTPYDDPKAFDGTQEQDAKYLTCAQQIARECLYVFSLIK